MYAFLEAGQEFAKNLQWCPTLMTHICKWFSKKLSQCILISVHLISLQQSTDGDTSHLQRDPSVLSLYRSGHKGSNNPRSAKIIINNSTSSTIVNLAQGKSAYQSSTHEHNGTLYTADLATDGNENPQMLQGACAQTGKWAPWRHCGEWVTSPSQTRLHKCKWIRCMCKQWSRVGNKSLNNFSPFWTCMQQFSLP